MPHFIVRSMVIMQFYSHKVGKRGAKISLPPCSQSLMFADMRIWGWDAIVLRGGGRPQLLSPTTCSPDAPRMIKLMKWSVILLLRTLGHPSFSNESQTQMIKKTFWIDIFHIEVENCHANFCPANKTYIIKICSRGSVDRQDACYCNALQEIIRFLGHLYNACSLWSFFFPNSKWLNPWKISLLR